MVGGRDAVRVLNFSAFHDTSLVCSGDLAYLGESWSKTVGSAGELPLQGDFSAEHMIFGAVPWTIAEHRPFLVGLENFGKGDWQIYQELTFPSKTPSQVASHAQKYFLHQSSAAKRKRRNLFDVVADMDTNSLAMPQQFSYQPLASGIGNEKVAMSSSRESHINNPVHSLELSLEPVIMPLPFQLWPPTSSSFKNDPPESEKELIGISHLTLEETKTVKIEPSPLSLRQPGEL